MALTATVIADLARVPADKAGVPLSIVMGQIWQESRFKPEAKGLALEIGLMQLLPSTARDIYKGGPISDLWEPRLNIETGVGYLAWVRREVVERLKGATAQADDITRVALLGYNGGPTWAFRLAQRAATNGALVWRSAVRNQVEAGRKQATAEQVVGYADSVMVHREMFSEFDGLSAVAGAGPGVGTVLSALFLAGLGFLAVKGLT